MKLPTEKSGIDKRYSSQTFGMIGAPGIGKSSFWGQDDKALFLDCEGGLNFIEAMKIPIRSWDNLRDTYAELHAARDKFPYSVIIIDPIDRVISYAENDIIDRAKVFYKKSEINTIGDIPEGRGWDLRRTALNKFLQQLETLPCAVAYISHLNSQKIKSATGQDYDKLTISVGGKLGTDLLGWTDHTLHVQAVQLGDKLRRTVFTKPTQSKEAKSRGGIIPDGWLWTDNDKENYNYFRGLFE